MKVLVVDRNTLSRKLIKEELSYIGYEVVEASDFNSALEQYRKEKLDLLIIDNQHEGYKVGLAVRNNEKEHKPEENIPIIYMSTKDDVNQRIKAFENGGNEFLLKERKADIVFKVNSILKPDLIWKGSTIAVVEDDRITSKFLSHLLSNKGAKVNCFDNAVDCFAFLKESDEIDLIVTDNIMPVMTGSELAKKIRHELGNKEIPIVFTSSTKEKEDILEFYKCGGNDFISKPFLKEEVYTKLKLLLDNTNKTKILNQYIEDLSSLNEVKDQFLAVCSHDLRAPLNSIIGYSDVLISDSEIPEDELDMIKIINKSAHTLLGMVNDLLTLSEIQLKGEFELKEVDMVELINETVDQLKGTMTKKIEFSLINESDHAMIYGNDSMLRRTFTNLLSNAYKFTADGGRISSRIWTEDNTLYCTVEDSGIGIPEKDLSNIFIRMSGVGRHGLEGQKSTGIGLSIVKEIVDKHNATIDVESMEGKGTTFTLGFELKKGA